MTVYRDVLGYLYDDAVPSFLEFTDGNPLDEEGQPKFLYHRPSRALRDRDDIMSRMGPGHIQQPNEIGSDPDWLYPNTGLGENPNPPSPPVPRDGYYAGFAKFADFREANLVEPEWRQLIPVSAMGTLALDGDAIVSDGSISAYAEINAKIQQSWGHYVVIGISAGGGEIREITRFLTEAAEPIPVTHRFAVAILPNVEYRLWATATFEYAETIINGLNFLVVIE